MTGCQNRKTNTNLNKINVLSTTDVYADIAKQIGGDKIVSTSIINSNAQDPHDFEPTTKTAKEVSKAQLIISNGLLYDDWIERLEKTSKSKTINVGQDVLKLKNEQNPHLWFNLAYMEKTAYAISSKLSKIQPKSKAYFEKNAKKFVTELKQITSQKVNNKNLVVYVSEPVFDYGISSMGLKVANKKFSQAIEREIDPSPKVIGQMKDNLKAGKVDLFVYNKQVENPVINTMLKLAKQNKVPILTVTETKPKGLSYVSWMQKVYSEVNQIIKKDSDN